MIQFKSLRQYTHKTNGVRFPQKADSPFLIAYFSENSNFINDYEKLNLKLIDFRIVVVPVTRIPRTFLTSDLKKLYKSLKLQSYSIRQKPPAGRNIILDLSQYITTVQQTYKPTSYRQRAGFLIANVLKQIDQFPDDYQKILLYSIDTSKDIGKFIDRKIFPIIRNLKKDDPNFDHMLLNSMSETGSSYRLMIKNKDYNFNRLVVYMRGIKSDPTEDEEEADKNKATNMVMKTVGDELEDGNKADVKSAVSDYLDKNKDQVEKIVSGDSTKTDAETIATTSIIYKTSGDMDVAKRLAMSVPTKKKSVALKAVDRSLSKEIIKQIKTVDISTDPDIQAYNTPKLVDEKSPEKIYAKRQMDFETNLKKDLANSFKVLETKDIPLKFQKITTVDKPVKAGEIEKSDIIIVTVQLKDQFGKMHNLSLELPKIDKKSGTFRLNGRRKCLINQIVQCPIQFPQPGESKFESSYSIFRIYTKTLRKEKFLEAFMTGRMPLFYLMAYIFGFEETLKLFKIKYEMADKKIRGEKYIAKINDTQYVIFKNVDSELKEQLCAGFVRGNPGQYSIDATFPSKSYFERLIISITGRINSTFIIDGNVQNIVDPVAKQVLRNMQLPTGLKMIMKYMADKVIQKYFIQRNDLRNQRIRNAEVMVHLAQKQIYAAYNVYREQVLSGNKEAQINLVPTKVLADFLNTELVVDIEYANPLEEISTLTRISPVGKKVSGIPDKRSFAEEARNIHDSYFGNVDPLDTPESGNIGIVQSLTMDALLSSSRGLFGEKRISNKEKTGMISAAAAMTPFLENNEGARIIMATNQAKQMLPLKNPQPPVVQSGYEGILTNVLSEYFIKRSPCTGKILSITREAISVQCGSKKQVVDIRPIHLKSGSGKNTLSVFTPVVKKGQSVKKNDIIAEGACMSNGTISLGRPMLVAMMPYKGYNFEDGIVISDKLVKNESLTSLHGIEEDVLVAKEDRILEIAEIGKFLEKGVPLIRKTMGEVEQIIGMDEDESTDMHAGQFTKKSPGGTVVDIEVFSNIGEDAFPQLTKLIKRTNKKYKKPSREKFSIKRQTIKGVLIRFIIEQELPIGLGDKLCNRFGNKGIISLVEKDELMPRTPFGERIEAIINPIGLIARMNIGQLYEMYCGLMAKELGKRIPTLTRTKSIALIKQVYSRLDKTPNKIATTSLVGSLTKMPPTKWNQIIDKVKKTGFYPIVIPPFKAPSHTDIRSALKVLGLKSAYKLLLPEYNTKTHSAVPVGYMYIAKLEHMGDAKIYARSTGPVTGKTAQPTSGKRREGGQRLGELDTYSFISYNCPSVLAEFMGPLSDDYITREEILAEIVQTGTAKYKEPKISPARDLLNSYFISLMLTR